MPPSANSNRPLRVAMALVNEPFSWPNNSLSKRFSGRAAQLTAISGPVRPTDAWWMARATCSLPVPVSPSIRTVVMVWATLAISSNAACSAGSC